MFALQNEVSIENKAKLQPYLDGYDYECSGLSFSGLYMWRNSNHFTWQMIGDYLCISAMSHLEGDTQSWVLFMPLTDHGTYEPQKLRDTILEARDIFEKNGQPFTMRLVPLHLLDALQQAFPDELEIIQDRPNFDYIYSLQELVELKGRAFHAKKNYVNSFKKNYEYEFTMLKPEMTDECMAFIRDFNAQKDIPEHEMKLLKLEEEALEDVFRNIDRAGTSGGAIRIGGKLQALTVGGFLGKDTVVAHVEKANTDFRGLYPTITNEFCQYVANTWPHIQKVNREEDMDIPGLRKAKFSYNPIKLLKKHIVTFK